MTSLVGKDSVYIPSPGDLTSTGVWAGVPWTFTIVGLLMGMSCVPICVWAWRRDRDVLPILLSAGGFLAGAVGEATIGHMDQIQWARDFPGPSLTAFGYFVPGLVPPVYAFYLGLLPYGVYRLLLRGLSVNGFYIVFAGLVGIDALFQFSATNLDAYRYYGDQPFTILNVPLISPVKDGWTYLLGGLIILVIWPRLHGWWRSVAVFFPLTMWLVGGVMVTWPHWFAVSSDMSTVPAWTLASLAFVLCAAAVYGAAHIGGSDAKWVLTITERQSAHTPLLMSDLRSTPPGSTPRGGTAPGRAGEELGDRQPRP